MSAQHKDLTEGPLEINVNGQTITLEPVSTPYRGGRVALSILLVILILILLVACGVLMSLFKPAQSGKTEAGLTWIRSIYSIGPMTPPDLIRPASVSFNPSGRTFWVADASHARIVEFDINGRYVNMMTKYSDETSSSPTTVFKYPSDIAVGQDGTLYVCEQTYNHVLAITPAGKVKFTILIEQPNSVVAGSDMVVIGGIGGFAAYQLDGTFIGVVGAQGKGDKFFDTVSGVVMDKSENLYVVDTYNNRLSKYNKKGNRVWIKGLGPAGNGGVSLGRDMSSDAIKKKWPSALQIPMGITMDASGRLIVIDSLDFSISAFNAKDGKFLKKWGGYGEDDGQLFYPNDIAYDKTTDVFVVTEPNVGRAQVIRLPGSGGTTATSLRRVLGDLPLACLWPLVILLLLLLTLFALKRIRRRRDEKNEHRQAQERLESLTDKLD